MSLTRIAKRNIIDLDTIAHVWRGNDCTWVYFKDPNISRIEIANQDIPKDSPIYMEEYT